MDLLHCKAFHFVICTFQHLGSQHSFGGRGMLSQLTRLPDVANNVIRKLCHVYISCADCTDYNISKADLITNVEVFCGNQNRLHIAYDCSQTSQNTGI